MKRRSLQQRCALQRQQVAFMTAAIEARLAPADRFFDLASGIAKNPLVVVGAIAGTLMIGPWRVIRWASQGMLLLKIARKLLGFLWK
jgi:hypothetical protein